ncbi:hypothetical protein V6N11_059058 [Hibiscus sabdariffa]|uniref:Uncharacterized protein n=1 Tax=Hibiscus sabdariffa TaxID=183260 RepID=A0ABR2U6S5_9ROSI
MEASEPLSIESFSYSWLVNLKPCLDGVDDSLRASLDACDEASFIEMDPTMPPSKRFFRHSQDFMFDFPISQAPLPLVHADELFSDGYVMPLFVNPLKMEAYQLSDSASTMPIATSSQGPPNHFMEEYEVELKVSMREFRRGRRGCTQLKYLLGPASPTPPMSGARVTPKAPSMRQLCIAKIQSENNEWRRIHFNSIWEK